MNAAFSKPACSKAHCYAPQAMCILGDDLSDCPEYQSTTDEEKREPEIVVGALPWTGLGLGADDIAAVAAVGRPTVIALVGAASAGKTTALAATFLALRRGESLGGSRFAGSFTLLGWQIISSNMQWPPHGTGGFPPHTTAVDKRSPCLLHLRLRNEIDGMIREVLLSDAPGEWFSTWAVDSANSAGAAWLAEYADAFVLFADSDALASTQRGKARADYEALARRLASAASGRPVLPVLSKCDVPIPEPILARIMKVNTSLFSANALPISIRDSKAPPFAALDEAIRGALQPSAEAPAFEPVATGQHASHLFAYRSPARLPDTRSSCA